ncbi:hypothetical protein CYLTODRAFT_394400 [Cylindrobasidium torrendii FP15055 ss-10]|uniref:EF-hand domain-containing protein n=1 Tax=Cylindrobasidium torrendii FP15055 ss-10 TaxID=1314674 RepID=A0A0D7BG98_9AGAR|nr:hypothetical protein CYLTODRAFT_394400 [Cylindrobasidium torrendii FP15055 ss-10]
MASATFFNLSVHTQRRIDKAYLKLCESLPGHAHKRRKIDDGPTNSGRDASFTEQQPFGGGGFIIEDKPSLGGGDFIAEDPPVGGGGFIVDDSANAPDDVELDSSQLPRVPLDRIPQGLKLLDLPPDDAQALSVFEQAASGWDDDQPVESDEMEQKAVGLDDWRAVCGILLEPHDREYADSSEEESPKSRKNIQGKEDDGSDGYDEEHASDEDYVDESFSRQRRRRTTRQSAAMESSDGHEDEDEDMEVESNAGGARRLNKRQKETALQDFANFFPDASSEELPDKKIMISDIQRVAKLLKEKIKAEDIVEMLEAFSTSADKSVSLSDFEQMMLAAKLA